MCMYMYVYIYRERERERFFWVHFIDECIQGGNKMLLISSHETKKIAAETDLKHRTLQRSERKNISTPVYIHLTQTQETCVSKIPEYWMKDLGLYLCDQDSLNDGE